MGRFTLEARATRPKRRARVVQILAALAMIAGLLALAPGASAAPAPIPGPDVEVRFQNEEFGGYLAVVGNDVALSSDDSGTDTQWTMSPVEGTAGAYVLRSVANARILDSDFNGNVDTTSASDTRPDRHWIFTADGDSYTALNVRDERYLDGDSGGGVDTSAETGADARWRLVLPTPPNEVPVVSSPGDQVSVEGDVVSLAVEGSDPDGDVLEWSAEGLPAGLEIDASSGVVSGTVEVGAAGGSPFAVTVSASDGEDAGSASFSWTVDEAPPPNEVPVVSSPGDQVSVEGDVVSLAVEGSDPDGDVLEWSAEGLPAGLEIDASSGVVSGTVEVGAAGGSPFAVTVSASDGEDAGSASFSWTVDEVVQPSTAIAGTVTNADDSPAAGVQIDLFAELDGGGRGQFLDFTSTGDDGTYSFDVEAGCYVLTFIAPEGSTFNGSQWFQPSLCVEEGATGTIDAQLDGEVVTEASIGGTIRAGDTTPVPGAQVDIFRANADGSRGTFLDATLTGDDGTYNFDVEAGCYVLTFVAPEGETYDGSQYLNSFVCVGVGEVVADLDAMLDGEVTADATIGGTVRFGDGSPAPGVQVDLFAELDGGGRGDFLDFTASADDGTYSFGVEAPGCYVLTFIAPEGSTFNGTGYFQPRVCVEQGVVLTDFDATLDEVITTDASLGGTVTDSTGAPVENLGITLWTTLGDGSRGEFIDGIFTEADGTYRFDVNMGCYWLVFIAPEGESFGGGDFLERFRCVESGVDVTDIDATLDPPLGSLTVSVGDGSTAEGAAGESPVVDVVVSLSEAAAVDVSVDVSSADGSATVADGDYVALVPATVTIPAGATEATVSVSVVGDDVFEADETFTVVLSDPSVGLSIDDGTGQVTIVNDDPEPPTPVTLTAADLEVVEGTGGTTQATFVFELSPAPEADLTVDVATVDGTATGPADFEPFSTTIEVPAGVTSVEVLVTITADDVEEDDEQFSIEFSNPSDGLILGTTSATVTITDDDTPVTPLTVSVGDGSTAEGAAGESPVVDVVVSLSEAAAVDVSVDVSSADGSATVADGDYVALVPATVTIPAGATEATVSVSVVGDDVFEADETFTVVLSDPSVGLSIDDGTGQVTIVNDDPEPPTPVTLTVADVEVVEGTGETTDVVVELSLSGAPEGDLSVDLATVDGTASSPDDFEAASETVPIPAGVTSVEVVLSVVADDVEEDDEQFSIEFSNPSDGLILGTTSATVTITDDDAPVAEPTLSIEDVSVIERDDGVRNAIVVFNLSIAPGEGETVIVDYTTVDGTATLADNDYFERFGDVRFRTGETQAIRGITIVGDFNVEGDETLTVELSNPRGPAVIGDGVAVVTIVDDD